METWQSTVPCKHAIINHKEEFTAASKQHSMASLMSEFPREGKTFYIQKNSAEDKFYGVAKPLD